MSVTCKTFLTARDHLHKLGFRADSYTDYCRSTLPPVRFLDMYRDALRNDRVGVGYGANSLLAGTLAQPGHTFRNVEGVGPYDARVQGGGSCAESIFRFSREDLRLLFVLKGLEGTPYLDAREYKAMFGTDLVTDLAPWWQALEVRGWLEWKGTSPMLVGEGVFYTSTVQRCISELRNRELRALAAPQPSAVSARALGA